MAKNHVMVPVPEELEEQVHIFLLQTDMRATAARTVTGVDATSAGALLAAMNDPCRTALIALSDGTVAERHLSVADLARDLHWTPHETIGVIQELQELVWQEFGPKIALVSGTNGAIGSVDWSVREVILWKELARAVVAAQEQLISEQ
jgi:hypothetical protein